MPPPVQIPDSRIVALPAAEIRRRFVDFFAERGHAVVPSASLVPGRRRDAAVHELRDGPVQGRPDRGRDALVQPGGRLPALPARRRQAQRLRGGRPDAAPPHAVRDARQLELRRLLQARGDPLGVGLPDRRPRHSRRSAGGHHLHGRRGRVEHLARRDRPPARADGEMGRRRRRRRPQLLANGRHRAVRTVQRDPFRSRRAVLRGPGVRARPPRALPALARDLEPGVHGVRPAPRRPRPAAVHQRRHGHGPRAPGERPAAGPHQLRHGPVHADPRPDARADRPRSRGVRGRALQLPGHRRPFPGGDLPDRRRRPAVQRGTRLRPAPDPAPRGPPWSIARPARAVHGRRRGGRHRGHGRGLSAPGRAPRRRSSTSSAARRPSSPGRSTPGAKLLDASIRDLAPDARREVGRRLEAVSDRRTDAARRDRLSPARHVRLPVRADRGVPRRVRRPRRPRRVRCVDGRAADAQPVGQEGGAGPARRAGRAVRRDPGAPRRHPVPRLRDHHGRRRASSRSCATAWSSRS